MRLLIITSCTGEKAISHPQPLTLADFQQGLDHVVTREAELEKFLTPAELLYTGDQHVRLMRGVTSLRQLSPDLSIDLWILSAGYGLVPATRSLAPYECTFQGMNKGPLRQWAATLQVPSEFRKIISQPYDLALVLLGDDYQEACAIDDNVQLGGTTLMFCGSNAAKRLPVLPGLRTVALSNQETKRFSCGLVGLKGELARRILIKIASEPSDFISQVQDPSTDLLALLDQPDTTTFPVSTLTSHPVSKKTAPKLTREKARPNPDVDHVIKVPSSWWQKPHRQKLRYFIPEWDDLVDPDYDFETDTHSGGASDWSNEVYAHQMYPEPNYDGLLISKVVAEKSRNKKERINRLGVHRFLRVPPEFPIIGDCGAFGYIMKEVPPYTTAEILDYYTRLGFNYGVSIDHLVVAATETQKKFRYELTLQNAADFLTEHRKRGLSWEPIAAVQGWDPQSYTEAARQCVAMGYRYIALGGMVRTSTAEILRILRSVHQVVPAEVNMHLFGVARFNAIADFARYGVTSVDSASYLRRAWMGSGGENYLTENGFYTAIRIPEPGKSFRAKRMVSEGRANFDHIKKLELACLKAMHDYDAGRISVEKTLDVIEEYDRLITPERKDIRPLLRRTLEAAPWKVCPCEICRKDGIEVIIFRGNNRNRRRGFHNTYVFYRLLQRALAGEKVSLSSELEEPEREGLQQLQLFPLEEALN